MQIKSIITLIRFNNRLKQLFLFSLFFSFILFCTFFARTGNSAIASYHYITTADGKILIYDERTFSQIAEIPAIQGQALQGVAISKDGKRAYFNNSVGDLVILDTSTNTVKNFSFGIAGYEYRGIAISPDDKTIYMPRFRTQSPFDVFQDMIDVSSSEPRIRFRNFFSNFQNNQNKYLTSDVVASADGQWVYNLVVPTSPLKSWVNVTQLDPQNIAAPRTLPPPFEISGSAAAYKMALSPDGKKLFVIIRKTLDQCDTTVNQLLMIENPNMNPPERKITPVDAKNGCFRGIALTPDGKALLLPATDGNQSDILWMNIWDALSFKNIYTSSVSYSPPQAIQCRMSQWPGKPEGYECFMIHPTAITTFHVGSGLFQDTDLYFTPPLSSPSTNQYGNFLSPLLKSEVSFSVSPAADVPAFPDQVIQTSSQPQTITLLDKYVPIEISNPSDIVAEGDFKVVEQGCTKIEIGKTCSIKVVFTPSALGDRTGKLKVTDSTGDVYEVSLSGKGVPVGTKPQSDPNSPTTGKNGGGCELSPINSSNSLFMIVWMTAFIGMVWRRRKEGFGRGK